MKISCPVSSKYGYRSVSHVLLLYSHCRPLQITYISCKDGATFDCKIMEENCPGVDTVSLGQPLLPLLHRNFRIYSKCFYLNQFGIYCDKLLSPFYKLRKSRIGRSFYRLLHANNAFNGRNKRFGLCLRQDNLLT